MKTTLAIALLMTFTHGVLATTQPDISYLDHRSVDEVLFNDSVGRRVILAADASVDDQNEVWALWMDPRVVDYFEKAKYTTVIYLDKDTHEDPYLEALDVRSLPSVVHWSRGGMLQRRMETFESVNELLRWLRNAQYGKHLYSQLYRRVASRPDDLVVRFNLITELNNEDMQEQADMLFPWLLNHNELWYRYENEIRNQHLEEERFRRILFRHIVRIRTGYNLFTFPIYRDRKRTEIAQEFDDWVAQGEAQRPQMNGGRFGEGIGMYSTIHQQTFELQLRRDNNTSTDRDLFILKALTAEGEEWEAMIKEYSGNTP